MIDGQDKDRILAKQTASSGTRAAVWAGLGQNRVRNREMGFLCGVTLVGMWFYPVMPREQKSSPEVKVQVPTLDCTQQK